MLNLSADSILIINQEVPLLTCPQLVPQLTVCPSVTSSSCCIYFSFKLYVCFSELYGVVQLCIILVIRLCFIFRLSSCISSSHVAIVIDTAVFNVFFFILFIFYIILDVSKHLHKEAASGIFWLLFSHYHHIRKGIRFYRSIFLNTMCQLLKGTHIREKRE